jgi:hypothetical protein
MNQPILSKRHAVLNRNIPTVILLKKVSSTYLQHSISLIGKIESFRVIHAKLLDRPDDRSSFIKHFNYLVGALDPQLFTFQYTRATSPFLLTVVLCISSRVFRPELYHPLREHAETLLGKVLLACDSAIENIWAIICIYYWKDVRDKRGYNLVGFALRMASSAGWHKDWERAFTVRQAGLNENENELETRRRRDRERACMVLGNLDRS